MNKLDKLSATFQDCGMDLILECRGMTTAELMKRHIPFNIANELRRAADSFTRKTRCSAQQKAAIQAARESGTTWSDLLAIERYARRIKNDYKAWKLRLKLARIKTGLRDIRRQARELLAAYLPKKKPTPKVSVRRAANGLWRLKIVGESEWLAPVAAVLARHDDPADKLAAIKEILNGGAPQPNVHTHVVITANDIAAIERQEGAETILRMTNGATITGARLAEMKLAELGYITIVSPFGGPVNTYRLQRSASFKQRLAASAAYPTCVVDGCLVPAEQCAMHHIHAWAQGGKTNLSNLVPLCNFHNGRNDDDPARPRNGRIERINGTPQLVMPWASGVVA